MEYLEASSGLIGGDKQAFSARPSRFQQVSQSSACDYLSEPRTPVTLKTTSSSLTAGFFVSVPYVAYAEAQLAINNEIAVGDSTLDAQRRSGLPAVRNGARKPRETERFPPRTRLKPAAISPLITRTTVDGSGTAANSYVLTIHPE